MPRRPVGTRQHIILRAQGKGEHTRDGYVEPDREPFRIMASIQPISDRILEQLEEGLRSGAEIVLYTTDEMKTVETNEHDYDVIDYKDTRYHIHRSRHHDEHAPIPHNRYVGVSAEKKDD